MISWSIIPHVSDLLCQFFKDFNAGTTSRIPTRHLSAVRPRPQTSPVEPAEDTSESYHRQRLDSAACKLPTGVNTRGTTHRVRRIGRGAGRSLVRRLAERDWPPHARTRLERTRKRRRPTTFGRSWLAGPVGSTPDIRADSRPGAVTGRRDPGREHDRPGVPAAGARVPGFALTHLSMAKRGCCLPNMSSWHRAERDQRVLGYAGYRSRTARRVRRPRRRCHLARRTPTGLEGRGSAGVPPRVGSLVNHAGAGRQWQPQPALVRSARSSGPAWYQRCAVANWPAPWSTCSRARASTTV
jgi:hypothetical protein